MRTDKAVDHWYKEPGVPSDRVSVDPNEEQEPEPSNPSDGDNSDGGNIEDSIDTYINAKHEVYGEILSITVGENTTVITYVEVDDSQVKSSMDLYDEKQLTEEELQAAIDANKD